MTTETNTEQTRDSKLATGNIWKLMFSLSIPSIVAQLVGILYNMVDRIFIGRIADGTTAIAALSVSLPLITSISAFTMLVGVGGAPLCAIKMGQKNQKGAEEILGTSFATLITLGAILTVIIQLFKRPILTLFGADASTLQPACDYVTIYAIGTIFVMISLGMNAYITTQGFARTGMITVLIGAILNILLDALFINILHLGIKGAAIATVLAQGVSCVWALSFLFGKKSLLKIRRENFRIRSSVLLPIMALGVSPFTMNITESLIQIAFNNQLSKYGGTIAVSTVAILFSLWQFVTLPAQGFCQGAQPIISFNYGARNYQRVRKACRISLLLCISYAVLVTLLMILLPKTFAGIFTNDSTLLTLCKWALPIYMLGGGLFGAQISCQQSFMALGQAKISLILACLRKVVLLAPLIYLLPVLAGHLSFAVTLSQPIAALVTYPEKVFCIFLAEPVSDITAAICTSLTFLYFYKKHLRTENAL